MKKLFLPIFIILIFISSDTSKFIFGCTNPQPEDRNITDIDKMKQDIINQLNTFTKKEKYDDSLHYKFIYYKDKNLKQITLVNKNEKFFPDIYDIYYYLYFSKSNLFYMEEIFWDLERKDTAYVYKNYISNGRLFARFENGIRMDTNSTKFKFCQKSLRGTEVNLKTIDLEK